MIFFYRFKGNVEAATAIFAMVTVNLAMQLGIVMVQNWRRPWKEKLKESLIVLSCTKPGVDAYRLAHGRDQEGLHSDAATESTCTKVAELSSESIPGGVLQLHQILAAPVVSPYAVLSVCISVLSTAYTSTTITYDYDVNPERRRQVPRFHGMIK